MELYASKTGNAITTAPADVADTADSRPVDHAEAAGPIVAVSRPEPLPPGCTPLVESDPARVGGYELRARLGDDGHGTLYAARDTTGALIAVRRATGRDLRTRRGFAASATRPAPPFSCAQVLGHGVDDGHPYLAREYVDGISLATLMAEDGPLDIVTLYGLALGTMAALAGLHDTGQAHGNLKPTNVMVTLGGIRLVDQGNRVLSQPPRPARDALPTCGNGPHSSITPEASMMPCRSPSRSWWTRRQRLPLGTARPPVTCSSRSAPRHRQYAGGRPASDGGGPGSPPRSVPPQRSWCCPCCPRLSTGRCHTPI